MQTYLGEIAALTTALLWALTSILFTFGGRRVGSRTVNRVRLLLATLFLAINHLIAEGTLLPIGAGIERWGWLTLSAVTGLIIGDGLLFYAFSQIGTRLAMLLMGLHPIIGTLLAWLFLKETLSLREIVAIVVTIGGAAWVVMERARTHRTQPEPPEDRNYLVGVLCGLGAAAGQATGLVLSKQGMAGDFPAHSASLMRVLAAAIGIWLGALVRREAGQSLRAVRDRRALLYITGGALVGPVLGMTLSLVAVQLSHVGIASTLMALSPVLLLPLSHWIFGERITWRAVLGTLIAMSGVALIFLE